MTETAIDFWSDLEDANLGIGEDNLEQFIGPAGTLADILGKDYEPMFRASHDVVLLSYGFKYGMSGETMHKSHKGDNWYVDLSTALPVWYKNNKRIGGLAYDVVVNTFREVR